MFPPVQELVPHSGKALLLSKILSHDEDETHCLALIDSQNQYLENGRVDAAVALELIAQVVAVHVGLEGRWERGEARIGFVIGAPKFEFFGGDYEEGGELDVCARVVFHDGPVGRFEGQVTVSGVLRAQGSLTVFEPETGQGLSAMMEEKK